MSGMRSGRDRRRGFTLIEVMGAMVIFTGGILMVLNLAGALSEQMDHSALTTEVSALVRGQVDSLAALGFGGLSVSTTTETDTLRGRAYRIRRAVSERSPLVLEIEVSADPVSGTGPARSYSTWVVGSW